MYTVLEWQMQQHKQEQQQQQQQQQLILSTEQLSCMQRQ
jgi:hypothetical protein